MLLNGTSSRAETTGLGGISNTVASARTIAAIVNRTSSSGFRNVLSLNTSANGTQLDMGFNGTTMICEGATSTSNGPTVSTGRMYLAVDKASGSVTPRFHKQIYGTDAVVAHSAGSGAVTENSAISKVSVGSFSNNADWFAGDIYVVGVWNRQLSDNEHEWLAAGVAFWPALNPDWLIVELGAALPTNIPDLSGNGAPLTTLTNLAVSTVSMPVSIGGVILPVTHPGGGAISETPTPGTATGAGISPTATVSATPTVGTATGAGTGPAVSATVTPGTATGAGISPTATISATPTVGIATGAGIAPSATTAATPNVGQATAAGVTPGATISVTPSVGTAAGVGIEPTAGSAGDTTPVPGVATAVGISPTVTISATPTSAQASGTQISPTPAVSQSATTGVATTVSIAPTGRVVAAPAPGIATVSSTAPAPTITVTPTQGQATGVGIEPFTPGSITPDPSPVFGRYREPSRHSVYTERHHLTYTEQHGFTYRERHHFTYTEPDQ